MCRYYLAVLCAVWLSVALGGCERTPGKGGGTAEETLLTIPVAQPSEAEVTEYVDYTGRTNAKDAVTIQPRVTGYLVNTFFHEGAEVKKGDKLFEIDPRPYKAQLDAADAAVAQNVASVAYAVATNKRFQELNKKQPGAVSERELDQYKAQEEQAKANLDLAKANLESAKLNLKWTIIESPIDGHISRFYLTKGNLVNQDVTQLTTVVSLDPMYAYFDMDEPTLLRIKRAIAEGDVSPLKEAKHVEVEMGLTGEVGYKYKGFVNFIDNQVNPSTGSISVRGQFENPKLKGDTYLLTPGMFVRIRLPIGQKKKELLIIDRAVVSDQGQKRVFVVTAENKVEERRITLGALQDDGLRVVHQGLKKEDWVVIGGLPQVRNNIVVRPERYTMPSLSNPAVPLDEKGKAKVVKGKK